MKMDEYSPSSIHTRHAVCVKPVQLYLVQENQGTDRDLASSHIQSKVVLCLVGEPAIVTSDAGGCNP
jgi:hypothetical protein